MWEGSGRVLTRLNTIRSRKRHRTSEKKKFDWDGGALPAKRKEDGAGETPLTYYRYKKRGKCLGGSLDLVGVLKSICNMIRT